ncbi:MAG: hypothetical protein SFT81_00275 [Candidatus Caenarcaniphilales bacterium]|nr:hypothetical protein [Candidatus Caenarcaniphilales bacterium]
MSESHRIITPALLIETASADPCLAIWHEGELRTQSLLSANRRYDSAFFINHLHSLLRLTNLELQDFKTLAYCAGPGQFSPLRVASLIARLLFRLNPALKIYKFNLTYLLFWRAKELNLVQERTDQIYLSSGHRGFFHETYNLSDKTIKQSVKLIKEMLGSGYQISESEYLPDFMLTDFMRRLIENPCSEDFMVHDLSEIIPHYIREANVSKPKTPPRSVLD